MQEESEILHLFSFNRLRFMRFFEDMDDVPCPIDGLIVIPVSDTVLRFMRFFEDMDDVPCPIDGLIVIPVSDTVERARTRGESYPGN